MLLSKTITLSPSEISSSTPVAFGIPLSAGQLAVMMGWSSFFHHGGAIYSNDSQFVFQDSAEDEIVTTPNLGLESSFDVVGYGNYETPVVVTTPGLTNGDIYVYPASPATAGDGTLDLTVYYVLATY